MTSPGSLTMNGRASNGSILPSRVDAAETVATASLGDLRPTEPQRPEFAEQLDPVTRRLVRRTIRAAERLSRGLYSATQSRIHVIVAYGFLRSLANGNLVPSRVGSFAQWPKELGERRDARRSGN